LQAINYTAIARDHPRFVADAITMAMTKHNALRTFIEQALVA
jgi:hypothetical protein